MLPRRLQSRHSTSRSEPLRLSSARNFARSPRFSQMFSSRESWPIMLSRSSPNHRTNASFASTNLASLTRKIVMFNGLTRKAVLNRSSLSRRRASLSRKSSSDRARFDSPTRATRLPLALRQSQFLPPTSAGRGLYLRDRARRQPRRASRPVCGGGKKCHVI
jgi:hypothetical protein